VTPELCRHLLEPATCTVCNGRDDHERVARTKGSGRPVPAKYPTRCMACQERVLVGDLIVATETGIFVHQGCAT
jgi:hypothetical protein